MSHSETTEEHNIETGNNEEITEKHDKDTGNNDEINENSSNVPEEWMIRRCTYYDDEYSDCTSYKARFNQYFIFGKSIDCSQWKKDSINCYKWKENGDVKAANEIVESEKQRRKERLLPHYKNDVWERRKSPPKDWNKPLPPHILQEYEYSYLNVKSKEMKGEIPPSFDMNMGFCSIM